MENRSHQINPYISVDCVVFGFDNTNLKVLLIERKFQKQNGEDNLDFKLPGDFITLKEDLKQAATRTLQELTGLNNIFLKPFGIFGDPERITNARDHNWLKDTTGLDIRRVVTTAYFSLIRIDKSNKENAVKNDAHWISMDEIPALAFDHNEILKEGLETLRKELLFEPIGFELLPGKFTIRQIQNLYEAILGTTLDNRNFRKKLLKVKYLIPLNEKQTGVAHKPARYYRFDRDLYEKSKKEFLGFNF